MKKLMVALLLLVAVSSIAAAQDEPAFIGMFADDQAVICHAPLDTYATTTMYVFAILEPTIPAISAAEFRIDNLVGAADALLTFNWNTDLVIGSADYGLALAFSPVIPGPNAFMGSIDFFGLADVGADYLMTIMASNDSGNLVVVDDAFNTIAARGGYFTFNCATGDCPCEDTIAVDDANMSSIKALY